MYKFGKKSLERLNNKKVHPKIKELMEYAIKTSPIDFTILETVRTVEQQKEYVHRGASQTMKSRHIPDCNKSKLCEAIDIAPYPTLFKDTKKFDVLAKHIMACAEKLNIKIVWGGTWKTLVDKPHFQLG